MMKLNSKKGKVLSIILTALVAASACAVPVWATPAPSSKEENYNLTEQPSYLSDDFTPVDVPDTTLSLNSDMFDLDTEGNYNVTPYPEYLTVTQDGVVVFGEQRPGDVWDVSASSYGFNGKLMGKRKLYSNYLVTGKYSYTLKISCASGNGSPISCNAYNASSNNKLVGGVTVTPGRTQTITLTGLSKTSKVFLVFEGVQDSFSYTTFSGTIS